MESTIGHLSDSWPLVNYGKEEKKSIRQRLRVRQAQQYQ